MSRGELRVFTPACEARVVVFSGELRVSTSLGERAFG
jgi:hypothetical protein